MLYYVTGSIYGGLQFFSSPVMVRGLAICMLVTPHCLRFLHMIVDFGEVSMTSTCRNLENLIVYIIYLLAINTKQQERLMFSFYFVFTMSHWWATHFNHQLLQNP